MASLLKRGKCSYSTYDLFRIFKASLRLNNVCGFFSQDCMLYKVAGSLDSGGLQEDRLDGGGSVNGQKREKIRLYQWKRGNGQFMEFAKTRKSLTIDEWHQEKLNFQNCFSFESQLMNSCASERNLSLGRSLMEFIKVSSVTPNLVTLSKYFKLLGDCKVNNLEHIDEEEILNLYTEIIHGREMIFDYNTASDLIHGICSTSRWREAISLVDSVQLTCKDVGISTLLCVASAAFRHRDFELGWQFMEKAATGRTNPLLDSGFKEWVKVCDHMPSIEWQPMMDRMLNFLRRHEIFVSAEVMNDIKISFESQSKIGWRCQFTTVSTRGICKSCNSRLEEIALSKEEFANLRDNFISHVIEGTDIFLKTNPKELAKFKEFVQTTSPYTIVLDGLNVAYALQSKKGIGSAKQFLSAIEQISEMKENCKILVIGRQHMSTWHNKYLNAIKRKAFLFFVNDLSKDDPYLLFAAMYSGQGTMILSSDMMRDHLFCLQDPTLASYFRKWLRGHQLMLKYIKMNGEVVFKYPLPHNPVVQTSGLRWHIPYDDGQPRLANEVPNSWMCLEKMELNR